MVLDLELLLPELLPDDDPLLFPELLPEERETLRGGDDDDDDRLRVTLLELREETLFEPL